MGYTNHTFPLRLKMCEPHGEDGMSCRSFDVASLGGQASQHEHGVVVPQPPSRRRWWGYVIRHERASWRRVRQAGGKAAKRPNSWLVGKARNWLTRSTSSVLRGA